MTTYFNAHQIRYNIDAIVNEIKTNTNNPDFEPDAAMIDHLQTYSDHNALPFESRIEIQWIVWLYNRYKDHTQQLKFPYSKFLQLVFKKKMKPALPEIQNEFNLTEAITIPTNIYKVPAVLLEAARPFLTVDLDYRCIETYNKLQNFLQSKISTNLSVASSRLAAPNGAVISIGDDEICIFVGDGTHDYLCRLCPFGFLCCAYCMKRINPQQPMKALKHHLNKHECWKGCEPIDFTYMYNEAQGGIKTIATSINKLDTQKNQRDTLIQFFLLEVTFEFTKLQAIAAHDQAEINELKKNVAAESITVFATLWKYAITGKPLYLISNFIISNSSNYCCKLFLDDFKPVSLAVATGHCMTEHLIDSEQSIEQENGDSLLVIDSNDESNKKNYSTTSTSITSTAVNAIDLLQQQTDEYEIDQTIQWDDDSYTIDSNNGGTSTTTNVSSPNAYKWGQVMDSEGFQQSDVSSANIIVNINNSMNSSKNNSRRTNVKRPQLSDVEQQPFPPVRQRINKVDITSSVPAVAITDTTKSKSTNDASTSAIDIPGDSISIIRTNYGGITRTDISSNGTPNSGSQVDSLGTTAISTSISTLVSGTGAMVAPTASTMSTSWKNNEVNSPFSSGKGGGSSTTPDNIRAAANLSFRRPSNDVNVTTTSGIGGGSLTTPNSIGATNTSFRQSGDIPCRESISAIVTETGAMVGPPATTITTPLMSNDVNVTTTSGIGGGSLTTPNSIAGDVPSQHVSETINAIVTGTCALVGPHANKIATPLMSNDVNVTTTSGIGGGSLTTPNSIAGDVPSQHVSETINAIVTGTCELVGPRASTIATPLMNNVVNVTTTSGIGGGFLTTPNSIGFPNTSLRRSGDVLFRDASETTSAIVTETGAVVGPPTTIIRTPLVNNDVNVTTASGIGGGSSFRRSGDVTYRDVSESISAFVAGTCALDGPPATTITTPLMNNDAAVQSSEVTRTENQEEDRLEAMAAELRLLLLGSGAGGSSLTASDSIDVNDSNMTLQRSGEISSQDVHEIANSTRLQILLQNIYAELDAWDADTD